MHNLANLNTRLSVLFILLTSCSIPVQPIEARSIVQHKTSRIYNLPIDQMKNAILAAFQFDKQINSTLLNSVFHYRFPETDKAEDLHQVYFATETSEDTLFSKEHFQYGSINDIYLHDFGDVWDSPVYYANNKPLGFRSEFTLKLDSIDSKHTNVTIEVQYPRVVNGTVGIGPHGSIAREVAVKPTTVEESTLLQYLATEIHDTSKTK